MSPLHSDSEEPEHSYAEVPIESIQQFVQIYGIVRDNYVDVNLTMPCFNKP